MKREQNAVVWLALLLCLSGAVTPWAQGRGPATAEERQKVVRLAHNLEANPLGLMAPDSRKWLMIWIQEVPDVSVKVCGDLLEPLLKEQKDYSSELFTQMVFSSAAFIVDNPDKAKDDAAVFQAGLEGRLKTYESIRKYQSAVRHSLLDDLLKKQQSGELHDYVRKNTKGCK